MPALSSASLLSILANRNATAGLSATALAANATGNIAAFQVVCAWPVSGQYGPGSRVLYYVLVAACVFARKAEWLRNACLAAALLFPAVAALHGIALAALHVDGAVDMDVYGAFQLCSIGILAVPITARVSQTYFNEPGRNTIFMWTGVVLAGLLSLTVEFYRIRTTDCSEDDAGNPISPATGFPYGDAFCGLTCSIEEGPYSPMRNGSANNIYVIPAPDKLTFNAATLLAAACCIPAILSLVSMWIKILESNWKTRFGAENADGVIDGTNGATVETMKGINAVIRKFLGVVEGVVFGAAVLTILVIGEWNFFSTQVWYQTEPIASVGQWAPIVGTGLAAFGSLYLVFARSLEAMQEGADSNASMRHCNCSHHHDSSEPRGYSPSIHGAQSTHNEVPDSSPQPPMREVGASLMTRPLNRVSTPDTADLRRSLSNEGIGSTIEMVPTASSQSIMGQGHQPSRSWSADVGNRRKVAGTINAIANYLGTAAHDQFDISEFKRGKALDFPEIPGEEHRNSALPQIREQYNLPRELDDHATPTLRERRSRASFNGSFVSGLGIESGSAATRPSSRSPSPSPSPTGSRIPHTNTFPVDRTSSETHNPASSSSPGLAGMQARARRDTLEVPSPTYHGPPRNNASVSSVGPIINLPEGESSPAIVVSPDPDTSSHEEMPGFSAPARNEASEP